MLQKIIGLLLVAGALVQAQAIRIACGAETSYTASDGKVWLQDQFFTGGTRQTTSYTVGGTADPGLYKWSRIGYYGDFSYTIPVANGPYQLTLKFAEKQFSSIGARKFNVIVNGTMVLSNFDVVQEVGYFIAVDKQFPVQVTTGAVNIQVIGVQNVGMLSGISLEPATGSGSGLQLSANSLTFDAALGGSNPPSQGVNLTTSGAALSWTATKTAGWLNLSAAAGNTPSTLTLTTSIAGLAAGNYTDTVNVTSSSGNQSIAVTLRVHPPVSATFVKLDTTAKGNWKTVYGGEGFSWVGETPALPSYGQLTPIGATAFTWTGATSDIRALEKVVGPTRVAATWYAANSFDLDLNITDGTQHAVALYALDYDNSGRAERVDVIDSASQTVLDTRTLTGFSQGQYLVWNMAGHVILRVTRTGGPNAIASGLFFGGAVSAPSPQPVLSLSTSTLSFAGSAGGANPASQSFNITNTGSGTLSWTASKTATWLTLGAASGTAPSTLAVNISTAGLAAGTYSDTITVSSAGATGSPKTVAVSLNVGSAPTLSATPLSLSFTATAGGSNPAAKTVAISNSGGGSLSWTANKTAAWLSLGAASGSAPATLSASVSVAGLVAGTYTDTIAIASAGNAGSPQNVAVTLVVAPAAPTVSVLFEGSDTTRQGSWLGYYGSEGFQFVGGPTQLPAYMQVSMNGATPFTWLASSSELRAVQMVNGVNRIASTWYGNVFTIDLTPNDAAPHYVSLYATDYDAYGRSERIEVVDPVSNTVLNTQVLSSFVNGQYLRWTITGRVLIRVTRLTGANAVVSGLFFGAPITTQPPVLSVTPTPLTFSAMAGAGNPAGKTISITNAGSGSLSWTASASQPWISLTAASGTAPSTPTVNIATAGLAPGNYSGTVTVVSPGATGSPKTVDVSLTVTTPPTLSLSAANLTFISPAGAASSQSVSISNTGTGTLNWTASSNQPWLTVGSASGVAPASLPLNVSTTGLAPGTYAGTITVTATTPFAAGSPKTIAVALTVTLPVTFNGVDTTHFGNWKGVYGADGYSFVGETPALPAYVQLSSTGASTFVWTQNSSLPRALQAVNGTNRIAGVWYAATSMTFDVNLTAGSRQLALYVCDYDGSNRSELIEILDAATGAVIDTRSVENFTAGQYLLWSVAGHIKIRVTRTGGTNAVVNGFFFDPPPPPPTLSISPTTVSFSGFVGGSNPAPKMVAITNTGSGLLNWTATQPETWLSIAPASGQSPSTLTLTPNIAGLAVGVYTSTITVNAPGVQNAPGSIAVTLTLTPAPPTTLSVSQTSLTFTGTVGAPNPPSQSLSIQNLGGGVLNWTAAKGQPWLSLSATSGSAPASLSIGILSAGLAAGSYTDTITVTSPGNLGSPQAVQVTFTLYAPLAQPVVEWSFDASSVSNNTFLDSSPNHLDAAINGGFSLVPGKFAEAADFNGTSRYLLTPANNSLTALGTDLTFTAWIRTANNSRIETLFAKYNLNGNEEGYIIETTPSGTLAIHLGGQTVSGPRDYDDATNPINDGQWHHIAIIIRPSQDVQFYVDGGLSSVFYVTIRNGAVSPALGIGGPPMSYTNLFTGAMDQVKIYARALSTSEIELAYGATPITVSGGEHLYNGITMPKNFPPTTQPTQVTRTPYYLNNPPRVIPINVGRQLFVDDFLVEQTSLQRTSHQAVLRPLPVLTPGSPISAGAWWDPYSQQYQMWYYDTTPDYRYAYSPDGLNWIKPSIPDAMVPNTNRVIARGDTIWLDLDDPDPARRYKSFGVDPGAGRIYVYFSPDGIHWTNAQPYVIFTPSDRSSVFWNPFRRVWVNSSRSSATLPATPLRGTQSARSRFYAESPDLANWSPGNPITTFWTGPEDQDVPYAGPGGEPPHLYNLDAVGYESLMVGMFSWFHPGIGYRDHALPGPILVELGVGFSRDGFSWSRPNRGTGPNGAFIPASNIAGTWNAYNTQSVGGSFLVVGDELWFYFTGRTLKKPLDGVFSTGLATLRRDGFVSMDAGGTEGTLTTRPLTFTGSHLFVNVKNPAGTLKVEALDAAGNVIPGFSAANSTVISIDRTSQEVFWNGANIGSLVGQNVRFKFYLTNGSLYSFWVTPSATGASYGYVAAGGPGFPGNVDTVGH